MAEIGERKARLVVYTYIPATHILNVDNTVYAIALFCIQLYHVLSYV